MKQRQPSSYTHGRPIVTVLPDALAELLPPGWPTDVPLARISTCGHLTVEVLQEGERSSDGQMTFVYGPPIMPHNGWTTTLNLLKLLVSQPGRFATKDWLTEKLRRNKSEGEEWAGLARVDNIVSLLRNLLCPAEILQAEEKRPKKTIGRVLVEYVPPTPESGSGYRLAAYPLIWVDVEAIRDHIQQACWLEAQGQDARAAWRSAYELANAGPFLAEGRYSDWAIERREEVDGYLWQSVQALYRYAMKQGQAGEEEALRLLREYWLRYPDNEDAFRPFVELLGKRGDYQRAEEYYAKLCGLLNEEGKEPDTRTVKAMNFLRSRQYTSLRMEDTLPIPLSPIIPQGIIEADNTLEKTRYQLGTQDMESSRRKFLQTLGSVGLFVSSQIQGHSSSENENHYSDVSHASVANLVAITLQFRAMQRQGDTFITNGVKSHIQTIQDALEQSVNDAIRCELWRVLAQIQTVAGFNPTKKTERGRAKTFLEAAVASAQNSGDALLIGASLGHLAHFSLREEQNLMKATQLLHQAQEYVPIVHPFKGWFALVMASIAAKGGHKQQCEAYLTDAMANAYHLPQTPDVADLYFTDFSLTSVHMFMVNCWLTIGNAAKAYDHLSEMNLEDLADNRRASAYCDSSRACAMMGEFDLAQQLAFRAIDKAFLTQQFYVIPRCMMVAQTIQQKAPDKPYAAAITEYAHLTLQQS